MPYGIHAQLEPAALGALEIDPTATEFVSEGWVLPARYGRSQSGYVCHLGALRNHDCVSRYARLPIQRIYGIPSGLHGRGQRQMELNIEVQFYTKMLGLCQA